MAMINWPNELVIEIARRRALIFLGSGVSRQSQNAAGHSPKTWESLLYAALEQWNPIAARKKELKRAMRGGDYLTSCEIIRDGLGAAGFCNFLKSELLTPNYQPAPIHDSIIQLGARLFATPNFDKIFEQRMGALPSTAVTIRNYYDTDIASIARATIPTVIKVHGTIDAPDRVIFTRADYANARILFRRFYVIFEALAATHTILFIGCGLGDPDIRLILEDQAVMFSSAAPHYFCVRRKSIPISARSAIERNLNVKFLEYEDHSGLKDEIDELVIKVNDARKDMQLNRTW